MVMGSKYIGRAVDAGREAAKAEREALNKTTTTTDKQSLFSKRFYEGGFEDPMSKREAALILGCRESASKEKINDRYRVLIRLNHPDMGGSPLISAKINEAKNLLYPTARSDPNYTREQERKKARSAKKEE